VIISLPIFNLIDNSMIVTKVKHKVVIEHCLFYRKYQLDKYMNDKGRLRNLGM